MYLLVTTALSVGCSAQRAPSTAVPPAPAGGEELSRLRAENEALGRRVEELEAERDRLRAKAEPAAAWAAEREAVDAPEGGEVPAESESERLPSVQGLPVVKLVPNPRASGSEAVEAEATERRPVLRVYGEEEGTVVDGHDVAHPSRAGGRGKS